MEGVGSSMRVAVLVGMRYLRKLKLWTLFSWQTHQLSQIQELSVLEVTFEVLYLHYPWWTSQELNFWAHLSCEAITSSGIQFHNFPKCVKKLVKGGFISVSMVTFSSVFAGQLPRELGRAWLGPASLCWTLVITQDRNSGHIFFFKIIFSCTVINS